MPMRSDAALALGVLVKAFFGKRQLRQHAVGHGKQVLTGLRQAQAAALAQPDVGAKLLLQLFHRVAKRRLRHAQDFRRSSKRAVFVHGLDDSQMSSLKHAL